MSQLPSTTLPTTSPQPKTNKFLPLAGNMVSRSGGRASAAARKAKVAQPGLTKAAYNPVNAWYDLLLRSDKLQPLPTGPLPHAVAKGGLGTAIGYGVGSYLTRNETDPEEKHRRRRNWLIAGGLLGLISGVPGMLSQMEQAKAGDIPGVDPSTPWKSLFSSHPFGKQGDFTPFPPMLEPIDRQTALETLMSDPTLNPIQRALNAQIVTNAAPSKPWITTGDLVRTAVGAGLGYGAGALTGKVLGSFFRLSNENQKNLARAGALGGALRLTGIWQ